MPSFLQKIYILCQNGIMGLLNLFDLIPMYRPKFELRSSRWATIRRKHLQIQGTCAVCGTSKNLQVHHLKPFHLNPKLELDENNLITLCGMHHLLFGHLMRWESWNPNCKRDAEEWQEKIRKRP